MIYNTLEEAQKAANLADCEVTDAGNKWTIKHILLNVDQVADKLECSKRKVWQMQEAGELPEVVHPTPGSTRWRLADIMKHLARIHSS